MSDLRELLGDDDYEALASAISETASDWLGHDGPYSPHGWRCEDKSRYPGPCGHDGEMADEVMAALGDILPGLLAQAWDEGRQLGLKQADFEFGAALSMPDLTNPYRQENGRG